MAIEFDFYKTPDPDKEKKGEKYHARAVTAGTVKTRQLAEMIHQRSTLTTADVKATLDALGRLTAELLAENKRVHVEGLGFFQLTLTCPAVETTNELHAQSIRVKSVAFRPEQELKDHLKEVDFVRTKYKRHSGGLTDEEMDGILAGYFGSHEYISRKDFERLCCLTRSKALQKIRNLLEQGKLVKHGLSRFPVYKAAPGYYADGGKS